jgi:DNA-binding CsgD family transcriptional regulator
MRVTREQETVDAVIAVVLAGASQLEIWSPRVVPGVGEVLGDRPVLAATALAATLPLAVRRRFPLAVLVAVMCALALQQVLTTPTQGLVLLLAGMIAAYSSSAYSSELRAAAGGLVIVAGAALIGEDASDWAFITVVFGGAWLVGFVVMQRSEELRRAREDNRALSVRLAEAADQLAQAQRAPALGSAPEGLSVLTSRELEVARAIAAGMSNAEIAAELFISEWTVKTHVASILRKLALRDRAQVVVAAYEAGLVQPRASAD